jgi:peroxiredoxin
VIEIGKKAPDFVLPATHGDLVSLVELTRRGPVLVVFVEKDCPTSRMTLERLDVLSEPFATAGGSIVAIHQDATEIASATMRRAHADYLALCEAPPFEISEAYDVATVPTAYLISEEGRVVDSVEGWQAEGFNRIAVLVAESGNDGELGRVTAEPPALKPGCASKNRLPPETWAAASSGVSSFDEMEDMFERGWTDGLPVVPPTRERVEAMLGGNDPGHSLGVVPPGTGELTLARLASCAVLAGCRPDYFPVVRAAAEAMLDPAFNVHGMTNTTHTSSPVVMVNGPVRERIGMNFGINAMGGWARANATIGRAVRLVIGLTGHGAPPELDRSGLGQPGKISFCFAENEEASPWESLAVTRGFSPDDSVVTLYCGDAPFSVSDHYSQGPEEVLYTIAQAGAAAFSPNFYPLAAETVFVVSREHARTFSEAGWSKRDVAERIVEASKKRVGDLRRGEQGPFSPAMADDEILAKWTSPDEVVIVVTGGPAGRFSAILPPWVGYGLGSTMVSRRVEEDA